MKAPPPDARWIWVSLSRATFGIIIQNGRVVDGAPYARSRGLRLVGMDEHAAVNKLRRLGADCRPLPSPADEQATCTGL